MQTELTFHAGRQAWQNVALFSLLQRFAHYRGFRRTRRKPVPRPADLRAMSDHMLRDIGLSRQQLWLSDQIVSFRR